jgi:nucleotide-binding universal stress UspA family protein
MEVINMKNVLYLVGIDGSEWSERAAERAVNLAKQTKARVKLVYVLSWPVVQPMLLEGTVPELLSKEDEEHTVDEKIIKPLLAKLLDHHVTLDSVLFWGDPTEILAKLAKEEHANMLFVGRRGRSSIIDMLLGSVANKLAHRAGVPIVLVP